MSFALTGKESIVVYGAGTQGKKFIEIFHKNGFPIKAILDKNAEMMNSVIVDNLTVQVILPEQYIMQSQEEVVIISLWNALLHEKVIDVLKKIGFKKIIFIPTSMSGNKNLMSVMRRTFNEILDGYVFLKDIPEYADIVCNADQNIIVDHHIYMPVELLFSEENFVIPTEELTGSELLKRKNVMKTAGENIANLTTYYQLYRYLDKSEGECDEYLCTQINNSAIENDEEKKKILKDRYNLFQVFEKSFELDRNFFWDSAPRVIWNKKGYFNIIDGHHRVAYLFYKGIWNIPVKIQESDRVYIEKWKNIPNSFLCESPYLIHEKNALFWRKKNEIICRALPKRAVLNKKVYINLNDAGYIARYCYRVGCAQCIDIEIEEEADFAWKVCSMLQYDERMKIDCVKNVNGDFDIVVIDEQCTDDLEYICATRCIIKFEKNGSLHDKIVQRNIMYKYLGEVFDGEKEYSIIQIDKEA